MTHKIQHIGIYIQLFEGIMDIGSDWDNFLSDSKYNVMYPPKAIYKFIESNVLKYIENIFENSPDGGYYNSKTHAKIIKKRIPVEGYIFTLWTISDLKAIYKESEEINDSYIYQKFKLYKFITGILFPAFSVKYNQYNFFDVKNEIAFDSVIISIDRKKTNGAQDDFLCTLLKNLIIHVYNICSRLLRKKKITAPKLYILIPSEHVNAPVGRNISFNFIRRLHNKFYNYIWMGSDDDDDIIIDNVIEFKHYILSDIGKANYDCSYIFGIYNQFYYTARNKVKSETIDKYAAWSYLFSPIVYNELSYRTAPMNKEDLDFFNRLVGKASYDKCIDIDKLVMDKLTNPKTGRRINASCSLRPGLLYYYNGPGYSYNKQNLFSNEEIIQYINTHHYTEGRGIDTPAGIKNNYHNSFYLNKCNGYWRDEIPTLKSKNADQQQLINDANAMKERIISINDNLIDIIKTPLRDIDFRFLLNKLIIYYNERNEYGIKNYKTEILKIINTCLVEYDKIIDQHILIHDLLKEIFEILHNIKLNIDSPTKLTELLGNDGGYINRLYDLINTCASTDYLKIIYGIKPWAPLLGEPINLGVGTVSYDSIRVFNPTENLNGDVYIILYDVVKCHVTKKHYVHVNERHLNTKVSTISNIIMFQNGKMVTNELLEKIFPSVNNGMLYYDKLKPNIFNTFVPITDDIMAIINAWNNALIDPTQNTKHLTKNEHIPLQAFGGNRKKLLFIILLFIILIVVLIVILSCVYARKCKRMNHNYNKSKTKI